MSESCNRITRSQLITDCDEVVCRPYVMTASGAMYVQRVQRCLAVKLMSVTRINLMTSQRCICVVSVRNSLQLKHVSENTQRDTNVSTTSISVLNVANAIHF